jgi:L,D-peptidoglycan transpeptidase YkuD (ErfK/YbiS/YcfS/YnhG family)
VRRPLFVAAIALTATLIAGCASATVTGHASPAAPVSSATATVDPSGVATTAASSADPATASPAAAAPSLQSVIPTTASASSLPLTYSTGSATQVITVVAASTSSTTATLQAWERSGTSWTPHGAPIAAHVGSAGLSDHTSEGLSKTPIGSFTLTQAFGALANPGTGLPYHKTTAADWWISQYGGTYASIYNTLQTCSGSCPFTQGDPNEHLMYETPYYNYAVVIDYNTSPVVQGAGSAFFLHVTDGKPTAGCVSIPQANLVSIMQWLNPAAQPRILIGVS